MVDERVLEGQRWVNRTYGGVPGYVRCTEDGITGWATMYSLTMGLQRELGISPLAAAFGPTTLEKLRQHGNITAEEPNRNIVDIVRYALWSKGYAGGYSQGQFDLGTVQGLLDVQSDIGLESPEPRVVPKVFKALLNMDAYVLLSGGSPAVREAQQWLNRRYLGKSTFFIGPSDGHFSRGVQQSLMKGIQYEIGIPEDQANGTFGPATKAGLQAHTVSPGSSGVFVRLFSAACVCNGRVGDRTASFTEVFDGALADWVRVFQDFSALDVTGNGNYQTWAQLLVSMGDEDRPVNACDTRFEITPARAAALHAAGYRFVGRYLENAPGGLNKKIQPGELDVIFGARLRLFPIWQMNARTLADFTHETGWRDGDQALASVLGEHQLPVGTVIYFAVDYDATDEEITSNIIPYFEGVRDAFTSLSGRNYLVGVYGSRNVCARVTAETYTAFSFVAGMSWGYSGNLGFPLPPNWSFNQIKEFSFSRDGQTFDLDNDAHRPNSDPGVSRRLDSESPVLDAIEFIKHLFELAVRYGGVENANLRVMEYLRFPRYVDIESGWKTLIGDVDREWIDYAEAEATLGRVHSYRDPSSGVRINLNHFGATANATFLKGTGSVVNANRGDFGGWGGDLCTLYGEWRKAADSYASGHAFCMDRLAQIGVTSTFSYGDLVEDADGYLIGMACREGNRFDLLFEQQLTLLHRVRFQDFYQRRYSSAKVNVLDTGRYMLGSFEMETTLQVLREAAVRQTGGPLVEPPWGLPIDKLTDFVQGYADVLATLAGR